MRYWYDWEFNEDGRTIDPISLGMVSEDGRELYLINSTYFKQWNSGLVTPNQWVIDNVINEIPFADRIEYGQNIHIFAPLVLNFISAGGKYDNRDDIELWGHCSAYDHVCLAQLFGPMINLPEPIPMFTNDDMTIKGLQQPPSRPDTFPKHHALADAKFQKLQWEKWIKNATIGSEV
jgi:hypothetical protein